MIPKIEGIELDAARHAGAQVRYEYAPGKWERGVLSSWRDDDKGTSVWVRFRGPQGELCNPEKLRWDWGDGE